MLGYTRSKATAEAHRQAALMMSEAARQMTEFWTAGLAPPAARKGRRKRR